MTSKLLPLQTLWRIVSEVDLDAIRQEAERTFRVLVAGEDPELARRLAGLLSSPDGSFVHPWLLLASLPVTIDELAELGSLDLAILVTAQPDPSPELRTTQEALARAQVPTVLVLVGAAEGPSLLVHWAGVHRVIVPELSPEAVQEQVAPAILETVPALTLALARQLPPLRPAAFQRLIHETAQSNATYAFSTGIAEIIPALNIPLNVSDLVVLTKNQLLMSYKIALAAGKRGTPRELMGEIVSVIGGGLFFRQLARQLVGLVPVWGIVPKVAVAYAGTWVIGQIVVRWATEGRLLSAEDVRGLYGEALARGRQVAQELVARQRERIQSRSGKAEVERRGRFWQRLRRWIPGD